MSASAPTHRANGQFKKRRLGKYNARGLHIDNIWFASQAEGARYVQLKQMQIDKKIVRLECQPIYQITVDGVPICNYRADFRYVTVTPSGSIGITIVEDVKGMRTPEYLLKKKLFEAKFKMPLYEIPASKVARYEGLTANHSTN